MNSPDLTKKQYFKKNHYTHILYGCGCGFVAGIVVCFSDPIGFLYSAISAGLAYVVLYAGNKAYDTYQIIKKIK